MFQRLALTANFRRGPTTAAGRFGRRGGAGPPGNMGKIPCAQTGGASVFNYSEADAPLFAHPPVGSGQIGAYRIVEQFYSLPGNRIGPEAFPSAGRMRYSKHPFVQTYLPPATSRLVVRASPAGNRWCRMGLQFDVDPVDDGGDFGRNRRCVRIGRSLHQFPPCILFGCAFQMTTIGQGPFYRRCDAHKKNQGQNARNDSAHAVWSFH